MVFCKSGALLLFCLLLCVWLVACSQQQLRGPKFRAQVSSLSDDDFIPLRGNWLNLPSYSNFKFVVYARNPSVKGETTLYGFIQRDEQNKRNPYQIISKTLIADAHENTTHFFDSNMEKSNTEFCLMKNCSFHTDSHHLDDIPFHEIMKSYESTSFLARDNVKFYDRVTDDICNRNDHDLVVARFHKTHFILCLKKGSRKISALKYIVGREFIVKVVSFSPSNMEESVGLFKSELHRFPKKKKKVEQVPETVTRSIHDVLLQSAYFLDPKSMVCELSWLKGSNCLTMSKRSVSKTYRCVFIHGYGVSSSDSGVPVTRSIDFKKGGYWGSVDEYTPYCTERLFLREETNYRGWNDEMVQQSVARLLDPNFKTIVTDTIIFAHSMGNLMVAGAVDSGLIVLDQKSTLWYNVMGPILGSLLANDAKKICNSNLLWLPFYRCGICKYETYTETNAIQSLQPSFVLSNVISPIVSKHVTGTICGTKSSGIKGNYVFMAAISTYSMGQFIHDGAVPIYSCKNGVELGTSYKNKNYQAAINHYDGTCLSGDSYFDDATCPCMWYRNLQHETKQVQCFGIDGKSENVCSGHGTCVGDNTCVCESGFSGTNCSEIQCFNISPEDPRVCSGNGKCVGSNQCVCNSEYSSKDCSVPICFGIPADSPNACNGGLCDKPDKCLCKYGYWGIMCDEYR